MAENTIKRTEAPVQRQDDASPATREQARFITPAVDIYEQQDGLVVVADMPGVRRDDLEISVEDNVLTIHGRPSWQGQQHLRSREFALADYHRQFTLGDRVDRDRISARLDRGVLTLELPHAEKARPRLIPVESE
jgi:HSP20 family molecular chaperone IbpA